MSNDPSWLGLVGAPQIQDDGVDVEERRRVLNFVGCTVVDNPDEERTDITPPGASAYTDEQAQDAVGTILVDSATIDFDYSDSTPSITAVVIDGSITPAKLADVATSTLRGRVTAGTGAVENLTGTQATTLLDEATTSLKGLLSAADKTKLDDATSAATASKLVLRDASGGAAFDDLTVAYVAGAGTVADAGLVRTAKGNKIIVARNAAGTGNVVAVSTESANNSVNIGEDEIGTISADYVKLGANTYILIETANTIYMQVGGTIRVTLDSSNFDVALPVKATKLLEHTTDDGIDIGGSNKGVRMFGATAASFGGGTGVLAWKNATTAPTSSVANEVLGYVEGGALKARSAGGHVETLAPTGGTAATSKKPITIAETTTTDATPTVIDSYTIADGETVTATTTVMIEQKASIIVIAGARKSGATVEIMGGGTGTQVHSNIAAGGAGVGGVTFQITGDALEVLCTGAATTYKWHSITEWQVFKP